MKVYELNVDGLVGPTHHYAGLAFGNEASIHHAHQVSNPKAAAKEGLRKMKLLHDAGLKQALMPPPLRPNLPLLHRLGFEGTPTQQVSKAFKEAPHLLSACYSASSMWTANAATLSAHPDTQDGRIHITPANLISQLHRAQEAAFTAKILKLIFHDERYFIHHPHLPPFGTLADEGAANHSRLCQHHASLGLNLWVYGKSAFNTNLPTPKHYPARQTLEAAQTIARIHGLSPKTTFFVQQHPDAIDAGVFHNDVIAVANESVFLVHAQAFVNQAMFLKKLQEQADFDLCIIEVSKEMLSLQDAVSTYFFNSQLLTLPNQTMLFLAPEECKHHPNTASLINTLLADKNNPIQHVQYVNLKQSMENGGGPACLRLRIPLTEEALATVHPGIILTDERFKLLDAWIERHYRDTLSFNDLADPKLIEETEAAHQELALILKLGSLY